MSIGGTCAFNGKKYKLEEEWDDENSGYRYQCQAGEGKVIVVVIGETLECEHQRNLLYSVLASLSGEFERCKNVPCAHEPRCRSWCTCTS